MLTYRWVIECNGEDDLEKVDNKLKDIIAKREIADDRLLTLLQLSGKVVKGDVVVETLDGIVFILYAINKGVILN